VIGLGLAGLFADVIPLTPPAAAGASPVASGVVVAFLATLTVELAVVTALWVAGGRPGRLGWWLLAAGLGNAISFPWARTLWFVFGGVARPSIGPYLVVELLVTAIEAIVFRWLACRSWGRAALTSAVANATSAALGVWIGLG
jgi:hypothetical protein